MSQCVPDDVMALVFRQLDLVDFCAMASTCRVWHTAARKPAAWPKTAPSVQMDMHRMCARPLSQTVWAASTAISGRPDDPSQWLGKINELQHVSTLALIGNSNFRYCTFEAYSALLHRVTTLETNVPSLALAVHGGGRLVSLTIVTYFSWDWTRVLSKLDTLTHLRMDSLPDQHPRFGDALGKLVNRHGQLRSIQLPKCTWASSDLLQCILYDPTCNLSSLRTLTYVPVTPNFVNRILERIPQLKTCISAPLETQCRHTQWITQHAARMDTSNSIGLASLAIHDGYYNYIGYYCTFERILSGLTELTIYRDMRNVLAWPGTYPRLRVLRIVEKDGSDPSLRITPVSFPNLETFSYCSSLSWLRTQDSPAWLTDLLSLSHFRHLDLHACRYSDVTSTNAGTLTRTLLAGMTKSPTWRVVTCSIQPSTIYIDPTLFVSFPWALVRWHVYTSHHTARIITFRPRIYASSWRSWVPGLLVHQVVWERV
jgi:hypothetical protein